MITAYTGVVVIAVGLIFMLVGLVAGWREAKRKGLLSPVSSFVDALTKLLIAAAGQPLSTVLFTFGILLIFLGGIIAGVSGLSQ